MKDLLERIFKYLPVYVPDLARLIGRPKTTIAQLAAGTQDDLTRALIFVGISVAIGFALQAPTLGKEHDFLTVAGGMVALKIVCILAFSAVIFAIMRLLGGRGDYLRTLTAYLYVISPIYLTGIVFDLINRGMIRSQDKELAERLLLNPFLLSDEREYAAFAQAAPNLAVAYQALNLAIFVVIIGWAIICWGAFRNVHRISRFRSAVAGILTLLAMFLFQFFVNALAAGIFGPGRLPLT